MELYLLGIDISMFASVNTVTPRFIPKFDHLKTQICKNVT